jgi:hypothetical protein
MQELQSHMKRDRADVPLKQGMNRGNSNLRIPQIPLEWMGAGPWRLPSGKALAEFALQAGFLAPLLLGHGPLWFGPARRASAARKELKSGAQQNVTGQPR